MTRGRVTRGDRQGHTFAARSLAVATADAAGTGRRVSLKSGASSSTYGCDEGCNQGSTSGCVIRGVIIVSFEDRRVSYHFWDASRDVIRGVITFGMKSGVQPWIGCGLKAGCDATGDPSCDTWRGVTRGGV